MFRCERMGLAASLRGQLLGGYDGTGSWMLHAANLSDGQEQEMVEAHEGLHHELQSSTGYGLLASISAQLSQRGVRHYALNELFAMTVEHSRQVHETFATTLSSFMVGVDASQRLLAGNAVYLGYLDNGLTLVPAGLPTRVREAAIAAVLRCAMAPAAVITMLERGFSRISRSDLEDPAGQPDTRLDRYRQVADPSDWQGVARSLAADHPELMLDDTSAEAAAEWPAASRSAEEMARVCYEHVSRMLADVGMPSVTWAQRAEVAVALKGAVASVDSDLASRLNVVTDRRPVLDDALEYDRQKIQLRPPLPAQLIHGVDPVDMLDDFALPGGASGRYVCAIWLARDVLIKQFAVAPGVALPDPVAAFMIAGRAEDGSPAVRLGLLDNTTSPTRLQQYLGEVGLVMLTSHLTLNVESTDAVLRRSTPVFVVMDLPVVWHVEDWFRQGAGVRMGLTPLDGLDGLELWLAMFAVDRRPGFRFLSIGGKVGVSLIAERLRQRYGEQLVIDGDLLRRDATAINLALLHILTAWHVLDQDGIE